MAPADEVPGASEAPDGPLPEPAEPETVQPESAAPEAERPEAAEGGGRNIQILAAVVFTALVISAFVLIFAGKRTPEPGGRGNNQSAQVRGVPQTNAMLDGIAQHGATLGNPDAPVTIVEFIDFQCPFCAQFELSSQPKLIEELVRTGKAKIQAAPLGFLGEDSDVGRNQFFRLAEKDRGWNFLSLAFYNQGRENSGYMTDAYLKALISQIPGTTDADASRASTPAIDAEKAKTIALAKQVLQPTDGTPFVIVGPSDADPSTYERVNQGAEKSQADSVIAAAERAADPNHTPSTTPPPVTPPGAAPADAPSIGSPA
jgi:protein-disulfide isomerase